MRPNAAAGLILGSASLWLLTGHWLSKVTRQLGVVCAVLVALLGFITLIEHLVALNTGIDGWLFQSKLEAGSLPGRLPVSTALSFLMSGIALLTLHFETRRGSRTAQFLALTVVVICLLTLLSYGYGIVALYHVYPGMAVHTSVAFFLLSSGILSAYPNR